MRRAMIRKGLVPALRCHRFRHAVQWQYTSTDESEQEDIICSAIDPHTEDEDASPGHSALAVVVAARMTRKVWVAHAPAHRGPEVSDASDIGLRVLTTCSLTGSCAHFGARRAR